jgi:predicted amidophosphoribosyltransferase
MVKKSRLERPKICPQCGAEITNLDVNYCMKCGNMLWGKSIYRDQKRIR